MSEEQSYRILCVWATDNCFTLRVVGPSGNKEWGYYGRSTIGTFDNSRDFTKEDLKRANEALQRWSDGGAVEKECSGCYHRYFCLTSLFEIMRRGRGDPFV